MFLRALTYFRLVLLGLVPMLLLIILNTRVFVAINSRKSSSRDNNYSTILLLIVAIFIICHSPRNVSVRPLMIVLKPYTI